MSISDANMNLLNVRGYFLNKVKKILLIVFVCVISVVCIGYGLLELSSSREFQFFGGIVTKANTKEKVVALTFDDGPTEKTDEIIEILQELDVKATFFLTGKEIEQHFDEAKKLVQAGHELGNHSYSHQRMVFKTPSFIESEIERTDELIRKAGYKGTIHFRPPYGKKLVLLPYYLNENNRKTILWNLEPDSYDEISSDSNKITQHVIENVEPGSIILLHVMYDQREESRKSVRGIVTKLKEQGYSFKTVSQLLSYDK
jgi:peptidoglycan/xylan/chitin deacetylase (PgdA/CDA1 family)